LSASCLVAGKKQETLLRLMAIGGVEGDDDENLREGKPKVFGCFAVRRRSCV